MSLVTWEVLCELHPLQNYSVLLLAPLTADMFLVYTEGHTCMYFIKLRHSIYSWTTVIAWEFIEGLETPFMVLVMHGAKYPI